MGIAVGEGLWQDEEHVHDTAAVDPLRIRCNAGGVDAMALGDGARLFVDDDGDPSTPRTGKLVTESGVTGVVCELEPGVQDGDLVDLELLSPDNGDGVTVVKVVQRDRSDDAGSHGGDDATDGQAGADGRDGKGGRGGRDGQHDATSTHDEDLADVDANGTDVDALNDVDIDQP